MQTCQDGSGATNDLSQLPTLKCLLIFKGNQFSSFCIDVPGIFLSNMKLQSMTIHSINGRSLLYNTTLQRTIWPRQLQYPNLSRQEPRIRVLTDAPACGFRSTKSNVVILRFCWSDPWRPDRNGCFPPQMVVHWHGLFPSVRSQIFIHHSMGHQKNGRYIPLMKPLKNVILRSTHYKPIINTTSFMSPKRQTLQ